MVAFRGDEPICEIRAEGGELSGLDEFVAKHNFSRGIVGTVRDLKPCEEEALARLQIPILRFTPDTPVPITNRYRTPETLGSDRLAAVIGASSLKPGKDLLIIDAGTCITYEVIDARGNYWGGNIAPGMQMRLRALHEFTARLPLVEAEGEVPGMGYNTETAIRSGLKRGGKLILLIEARDGGGPEEYFDWIQNLLDGSIEKRLRESFTVPGYIFFLNCEQAQRYQIYLLTSIPNQTVAPMGIHAYNNMKDLLEAAQIENDLLYVIPNGSTVIPYAEEA